MSTRPCIKRGHADPVRTQAECLTCWKALHDERYAAWHPDAERRGTAAPKPLPVIQGCAHEGVVLVPCESCGKEGRHIRDCDVHGRVTRVECGKDVDMTCVKCRRDGLGFEAVTGEQP